MEDTFSVAINAVGRSTAPVTFLFQPWMDTAVRTLFGTMLVALAARMWFYAEPSGFVTSAFCPADDAVPVPMEGDSSSGPARENREKAE